MCLSKKEQEYLLDKSYQCDENQDKQVLQVGRY